MSDDQANQLEKTTDLGKSPEAIARRWKLELKLANKRESDWRKKSTDIYKLYTPPNPANNSFNILWPNTETLRQSVYNSLPQPQVKRRYSDQDPLGKAVSDVLTRALEFSQDTYDFDAVLKGDVLAMLLPGRAVSRVRYIPDFRTIGGDQDDDSAVSSDTYEEIEWEQVVCERVQFDDFRILCAAKTWEEVTAIGFKHRFTRDDCIEKFGEEIGKAVPLDAVDDEDVTKSKNDTDLFKTAEIWEIWDKDNKEVLFICPTYDHPCKVQDDPLGLQGFFPIPKPLYAIENDQSLVPAPLYTQYEQQAKELNTISTRINKLISALKVRGIYDTTLGEVAEMMKAADNELVPAQNVTALLERGGIDKAIWMMPIDVAAAVIKELFVQRDAIKQTIYEITGISDIMRSASDPNETYGAQKIKTQWGTQRLQRMQREVQRYIRDLIRLKAEIISEKFQPETLEKMTLVQLPHQAQLDQQKAQIMQQYQVAVMQAQQQGQQPPPPPQLPPMPISWEAVVQAMHDDAMRTYHVDIETDSTISATQDADMSGLRELLTGLTGLVQGFGEAVMAGAMPIEAVKEIMLAVTRRARMGSAVEDAISKMQQPQPRPDPNAAKAQSDAQLQQAKIQGDMQMKQMEAQLDAQQKQQDLQFEMQKAEIDAKVQMHAQQVQAAQIEQQNKLESERETQRQMLDAQLDQRKQEMEAQSVQQQMEFDRWKAELDASTKITVAQIAAQTTLSKGLIDAEQSADAEVTESMDAQPKLSDVMDALNQLTQHVTSPKTIERGPDGKAVSVGGRTVQRGPDGKIIGIQ